MVKQLDFSKGSTNTYKVELRHRLIPRCIVCGEDTEIILDGTQYFNYFMKGMNIQTAFPNLTGEEREVIITGTHPECWDKLMED